MVLPRIDHIVEQRKVYLSWRFIWLPLSVSAESSRSYLKWYCLTWISPPWISIVERKYVYFFVSSDTVSIENWNFYGDMFFIFLPFIWFPYQNFECVYQGHCRGYDMVTLTLLNAMLWMHIQRQGRLFGNHHSHWTFMCREDVTTQHLY
jgi:hypothetical protein